MAVAPLFKPVRYSAETIDYERRLEREGLASLDYDDGTGGIKVGNKGSGKLLDVGRAFSREVATAELERRCALFKKTKYMTMAEERVYGLYADGVSTRKIGKRLGLGRMAVFRIIAGFERRDRPNAALGDLLARCEPSTVVLFFALLERALEEPRAIREMIGQARSVPEIRAMLEPDKTEVDDG
jgi:hypothetical protein